MPKKIQYLTGKEYRAFGFSKAHGDALVQWMFERTGFVIAADGSGGSGVFVMTSDGRLALLTARHVALRAILSGRLTIGRNVDGSARTRPPSDVWVSAKCDAALLIVPDELPVPAHLTAEEWNPRADVEPDENMRAIAVGVPGVWKGKPNLAARVIRGMMEFAIWTELGGSRVRSGLIESKVNTQLRGMPSTMKGMSGGPLFATDRRLLGVHHGQNETRTQLLSTPRTRWTDLFSDLCDEPLPNDLTEQPARYIHTRPNSTDPAYEFCGHLYWSRSGVGDKFSGFGVVSSVNILAPGAWNSRPLSLEARFYFQSDCDEAERRSLFDDEARSLIAEMFTQPSGDDK